MKLHFSGCYNALDTIYCCITGPDETSAQIIKGILAKGGKKFVILAESLGDQTFERFTLTRIQSIVKPDDKVLYFHTKGITQLQNPNVYDWRTLLEYFLFTNHALAIQFLDTYDTVGVNWSLLPKKHYSGNFWWATGRYLLTLPQTIGAEYHDPEFWIGLGEQRAFELYSSKVNHYRESFPYVKFADM